MPPAPGPPHRRIAVLGSANADLVVRAPRAPQAGETVHGSDFSTGPGGKGLNQAVAAARAGGDVDFIGAVGGDEHGALVRSALTEAGVRTEHLAVTHQPTGVAAITVTADGENSIVVVPGANALTHLDDGAARAVATSGHLVVQLERPPGLVREALRTAREHGTTTVLTPAPVAACADDLLDLADVLVLNAGEALALTGEHDPEAAACSLSRRASTVVVTLGPRGAVVAVEEQVMHLVPGRPVTAVDTTGAGDTFVGALVAWLSGGSSLQEALEAATAAASLSVTRHGASSSAPTRAEVVTALASGERQRSEHSHRTPSVRGGHR